MVEKLNLETIIWYHIVYISIIVVQCLTKYLLTTYNGVSAMVKLDKVCS